MKSKDYIFKSSETGLDYVGDFDAFYKNESDPWGQSGESDMAAYYQLSRDRLNQCVGSLNPSHIIEVGCGLGYTTRALASYLPRSTVIGVDISEVAISRAKRLHGSLAFYTADIQNSESLQQFVSPVQCIILNQMLWYVLPALSTVIKNCFDLLSDDGCLVVSNAFLQNQQYGREWIDGFGGAFTYFDALEQFTMEQCSYIKADPSYIDGLFVLKKSE